MADDAGVLQQPFDVGVTEGGDRLDVESGEGRAEVSRLRRIVSHDSPDWKPSRQIFSKSRVSSRTGRPHSVSWYARYSVGAAAPEAAQQAVLAAVEQVAVDEGLGHRA